MQLSTLKDLLVDELKDIYSAEQQITKALPQMAQKAHSPELKKAFEDHLRQTENHIQRLDQVFQKLGQAPTGKFCKGMDGLLKEGQEMMQERADPDVLDAAMISAAQRVEHYEIAAYGTVRTYANELGDGDIQRLLQQTLDEEGDTDKKLTRIAESKVNQQAAKAA